MIEETLPQTPQTKTSEPTAEDFELYENREKNKSYYHNIFKVTRKFYDGSETLPPALIACLEKNATITGVRLGLLIEDASVCWGKIKYKAGVIEKLLEEIAVETDIIPNTTWMGEGQIKLVRLCRLLQKKNPDKPFTLSSVLAGRIGKVSKMTGARWIITLMRMGFLKKIDLPDHSQKKATTYRYVAN